jgi:hypothetical protein
MRVQLQLNLFMTEYWLLKQPISGQMQQTPDISNWL